MILIDAAGTHRELDLSPRMAAHTRDPRNYVALILDQINNGLYSRFASLSDGGVVLDLGANVGMTAVYFAGVAQRVIAVEPLPDHLETLRETVVVQKLSNKVMVLPFAVARRAGPVEFNLNPSNPTACSLVHSPGSHDGKVQVMAATVQDILEVANVDRVAFAKVDIEGGEVEIAYDLAKAPIRTIFIECHDGIVGRPIRPEIEGVLKGGGFNTELLGVDGIFGWRG